MQSSQLSTSSVISSTLPTLPNLALSVSSPRQPLVAVPENDDVLTFKKQQDGESNSRFIDPFIDNADNHYNHQSNHCYNNHRLLQRKRRTFLNFPPRGGGQQGTTPPFKPSGIGNTMKDMFQDNNNFGNNIRFNFDNGDDDGDGGGDSFTEMFYDDGPSSPSSSSTAASKVASSLFGLIFGPFIIFASCALLWHNEKWAIKTHRSLNEALNAVQSIPTDNKQHDKNIYDEKLIHYTGLISAHGSPYDYDFQLQRTDSISIQRKVEIYQWVETKHETRRKLQDGRTQRKVTYSYNKRWTDRPIPSERFRKSSDYRNVGYLPFESETFYADRVFIGPFQLPKEIFGGRLNVGSTMIHPRELEYIPQGGLIEGTSVYFPTTAIATEITGASPTYDIETTIVSLNDEEDTILYKIVDTGELFHTKKEAIKKVAMLQQNSSTILKPTTNQHKIIGAEPQIGDVRVRFSEVKCKPATVVGKLSGHNIVEWQSNQGEGYDVALFQYGTFHAKDLVENAQSKNTFLSWALRGGGFLLSYIGFSMTTSIISATANLTLDWIPFLGPMATTIINVGLTFANFILASSLSLLVASVSWLFYRPLIGTPLLMGSVGIFYMASQLGVVGLGENGRRGKKGGIHTN